MSRSKRSRVSSSTAAVAAAAANISAAGEKPAAQEELLLPGLPDHLAHLCLSSLPPSLLFSVSRSWRRLLSSPHFPPYPNLYALLSGPDPDPISLSSFDRVTAKWAPLPYPPLPSLPLTRHPSFIARRLPIQSASAAGKLVLVSATAAGLSPAITRPLVFDPSASSWHLGPAIRSPRRWCAVGSAAGAVYVASGVGSEYSSELARSAERWDLKRAGSGWEPLSPLRDGRFSREPIEMVFSNGKLCMVNSRGRGAKEGIIYDVGSNSWAEMPAGLLLGWVGPAAVVEDGGPIFVVDDLSGVLRRYEWENDTWTVVMESEGFKGAVGVAGGGGMACVTCGGGAAVMVVDVKRGKVFTVLPPEGRRVAALHVLPRMRRGES